MMESWSNGESIMANARAAISTAKASTHEMEGRKAPPFELPGSDGKPVSLNDLLAHGSLVLYFYPRT